MVRFSSLLLHVILNIINQPNILVKKIVLFLAAFCLMSCENSFLGDIFGPQDPKEEWVDLGLTSGTIWKSTNEVNPDGEGGLYTYQEAEAAFGDQLPTKEQWEELENECRWEWTGRACKITGPNGNYFLLPGLNGLYHTELVKSVAYYWSSTSSNEDIPYMKYTLYVSRGDHRLIVDDTREHEFIEDSGERVKGYYKMYVRLVQKK